MCFGCLRSDADCRDDSPGVAADEQGRFNGTVYGSTGVRSLAARESRVVRASPRWGLVDGYALTRGRCEQTDDGEHYDDQTTLREVDAALRLVRRGPPTEGSLGGGAASDVITEAVQKRVVK